MLFKDIRFESRIINELAKSAFTCYLFHGIFLKYIGIKFAVQSTLLFLVMHQVAAAIGLYLLSYPVYKTYNILIGRFIENKKMKIDEYLSL